MTLKPGSKAPTYQSHWRLFILLILDTEAMQKIKIHPGQSIVLEADSDVTPTQALVAAIYFSTENQTKECTLLYHGYAFDIEPDSDINTKVRDYREYLKTKNHDHTRDCTADIQLPPRN